MSSLLASTTPEARCPSAGGVAPRSSPGWPTWAAPPRSEILAEPRRCPLDGEVPPGSPIPLDEGAEVFGLGRIPVREAPKTLIGEGLVEHRPNAGYVVARLTAAVTSAGPADDAEPPPPRAPPARPEPPPRSSPVGSFLDQIPTADELIMDGAGPSPHSRPRELP